MVSEYRGGDPGADTLEDWSVAAARRALAENGFFDPWAAVERVRALHGDCNNRCGFCHECGARIPCATMRALDGDDPIPPRIQHPFGGDRV